MKKRYVVIGGRVVSKSDGQEHHVTANQLARLYGVWPEECYFFEESDRHLEQKIRQIPKFMIVLRPLASGDYDGFMKAVNTFSSKTELF